MRTNIEKVVKGLKKIEENAGCNDAYFSDCHDCSYEGVIGCCREVINDAIALLKAQEPRVMTLEEVREKKPFVLWVEDLDTGAQVFQVALIEGDYRDMACDWCTDIEIEQDEDYGKRWRYWDKRPTDKQRRDTPWE